MFRKEVVHLGQTLSSPSTRQTTAASHPCANFFLGSCLAGIFRRTINWNSSWRRKSGADSKSSMHTTSDISKSEQPAKQPKPLLAMQKQPCDMDENMTKSESKSKLSDMSGSHIEEIIFEVFKGKDNRVPIGRFLSALTSNGLRKTDPRLKECMQNFKKILLGQGVDFDSTEGLSLDQPTFKDCITNNVVLITRALRNQFIIPEYKEFNYRIDDLYWRCKSNTDGKVADYIPQLARFNPDYWAVSICTVDGQRHSIGDTQVPFCLQSTSKVLNYSIALNDLSSAVVHQYVGQEPSGRIFNDLCLDYNNKPHNPCINAGAILTASLIQRQLKLADRFDYVMKYYRRMCGGEFVGFSNATFLSERETADRNYALGYFMKEHNCFPEGTNLHETLDFYFQLCSVEVTCESASVMAATLANGGICPITDDRVISSNSVRNVLSLMYSCGMYDYSGQFAFKVGLPAKSGVSGILLVVVPNVLGMAIWSPSLDRYGNSVRGVQFCEEMVRIFNFHNYDNLKHTSKKMDPRRRKVETRGQQVVNLLFSAANGDITAMRRYMLSGLDMNQADYDGRTALHLAAAEGQFMCVKFLLEKCGVQYSPLDRWENTPIEDALRFGHDDVVELLQEWEQKATTHDPYVVDASADSGFSTTNDNKSDDDEDN